MSLLAQFETAAGSIIGTDHVRLHKNNQDAHVQIYRPEGEGKGEVLVGVVCDGCGDPTSPHSEVGAKVGARMLARLLVDLAEPGGDHLGGVRVLALNHLKRIAIDCMSGYDLEQEARGREVLKEHFLFTTVGYVIDPTWATFFSIGDGTLFVNGQRTEIGPFPDNMPPYLTYSLMGSTLLSNQPELLQFKVHQLLRTRELESFLIGSDGAEDIEERQTELIPNQKSYLGGLAQFWIDDQYFLNPQSVTRKLALANTPYQQINWEERKITKHPGLLHDDTTLIVGRRRAEE
jgi:hypothetical protein